MKRTAALALAAVLAGCQVAPPRSDYSLIDPAGVDMHRYRNDYAECSDLANQTSVGERAAGGAVFGALLGALIGGAICGRSCAEAGARGGLVGGTVGATTGGIREQQTTLRACLAGRGYVVIR
ncbi:MAG: hypothetical protein ACTS6J_12135 [Burkholderiales bacterium]